MEKRISSLQEIEELPGTEDWQEMYPYYYPFADPAAMPKTAAYEDSSCWFFDGVHYPEPVGPLDLTWADMWHHTSSAWVGRIYMFPRNRGRDHRILNGRVYIHSTEVTDPEEIKARLPLFQERTAYTLKNWKELFSKWESKVSALIRETEGLRIPALPEVEPISVVTEGKWSTGHDLLIAWNRLMENVHLMWEWHFEFCNIVTLVNVQYIEAVRRLFPGITDNSILQTMGGLEPMMFRAAKALLGLAKLGVELRMDELLLDAKEWEEVVAEASRSDAGKQWLAAWEEIKEPWFNMSAAKGWHHTDGSWKTNPLVPLRHIQRYIQMLREGGYVEKSLAEVVKDRDRVTAEYRDLIRDEKDREVFDALLDQARKVSHYTEDREFYVENWFHTVVYGKFQEFGKIMTDHGVLEDSEEIFFMNRFEIPEVLYDVVASWYCGVPAYGREYWPPRIARRKAIMERFRSWHPPDALGPDILKGKRVLVVDDEEDIREVLTQLLSMCRLEVAGSFEEARDLLKSRDYDIAVLDIMGVKGYELLEIANQRNIPALMLTAHALSEEHLRHSAGKGAAYYAPKDEIAKIDLFITDVLEAKEKKKNVWLEWFDRLGGFFDKRFGGTAWREKAFWEEKIGHP
ncbi:MAG: response regulator [Desulfobacteraceae bacterium]|nr:MAG: response regulator [Desulfobacteraceae bacterium]